MKLISVKKANDGIHKLIATFETDTGRTKHTKFGATGYDDYTLTHDAEQRNRYRARHEKDLKTGDPTKAGFLSYYILWGESTNIQRNVSSFKHKFSL